jgi:predicted nucleic acid-binding protein
MIVSNSSPIIILGKQARLELLKECFKRVIIPKTVYCEIKKRKDNEEAISLEKAIKDRWLVVEEIKTNEILLTDRIGQGEKEAISLAAKYKALLLMDDAVARGYASILGVEFNGTLFVILLAFVKGFISREEARKILERMILDGFYVSTQIYSRFLDLLNSIS